MSETGKLNAGCRSHDLFGLGAATRDAVKAARKVYEWKCDTCGMAGTVNGAVGWDSSAEGDARIDHGNRCSQRCQGRPRITNIHSPNS